MTNKIKMLAIAGLLSMGTAFYAFTPKNETCPLKGTAACPEIKCELKGTPECPLKEVPNCCKK